MKQTLTLVLIFLITHSFSQSVREKELKTEINEVTVFLYGAQIFESGSVIIPAGQTTLNVKDISPFLDERSIQVKAEGNFTILSVNRKFNYLQELVKDAKVDSLKNLIDALELILSRENGRLEVMKEKQSVLNENKKIGGTTATSIAQLKQTLEYYESEISKIKEEEINTRRTIDKKTKELVKLQLQLNEVNEQNSLPGSEIEIRVSAENQVNAKFNITYLVGNAGWYPKYDVRVQNIKSPLELTYKAEVYQNTGVDWKNVKLRFSNGNPNQSGIVPELSPWNLSYEQYRLHEIYGKADIERGVIVEEKSLGGYDEPTVEPKKVPMDKLGAKMERAKTMVTNVIENQTTVEIEVAIPYSIKSNGEKLLVDLRKHELDALYEYYAVPKLDKDAFLVARLTNWDQYNLLEGEANLYFEDAYVGRSVLDARSLRDTLTISLGRDKNIVVGREKIKQFSKRRTLGGNMIETRGFKLIARNKKSQPIKLTIFDQVPLSVMNDITVNALELSKGKLDEKTGRVTWELQMDPQQQKELILQYEVKYPKRESVVLE
jgi:uncharacterized protein (TIGR02231 family)